MENFYIRQPTVKPCSRAGYNIKPTEAAARPAGYVRPARKSMPARPARPARKARTARTARPARQTRQARPARTARTARRARPDGQLG